MIAAPPLLTWGRRSRTHTSRPSPASSHARPKPAKPAPTIATSTRSGPSIELSSEPYVAARHRTMRVAWHGYVLAVAGERRGPSRSPPVRQPLDPPGAQQALDRSRPGLPRPDLPLLP